VLEVDGEATFVQFLGNEKVLCIENEEINSLPTINRRTCNLIGHIWLRNLLIKHHIADGRS